MRKLTYCLIAAVLLALCAGAAVAETRNVTVTGVYGQTEARSMLEMVNAFRTGGDAWYWSNPQDEPDSESKRIDCTGLGLLEYDYNLERAAMQRAFEIALYDAHQRPNGADCYSAIEGMYWAMGENIAIGYGSAEGAFIGWREDDYGYGSQGHRRNMLNAGFNRIGIGHAVVNGCHCWVQELGYSTQTWEATGAADGEAQVAVEVDLERVSGVALSYDDARRLTFRYGESVALPNRALLTLNGTWYYLGGCPVALESPWNVADASVAAIANGTELIGLNVGDTVLTTTLLDRVLEAAVTVNPIDLSGAQVGVADGEYVYTGEAHTPQETVTLDGTALAAGRDYLVSYAGNVDAGQATLTVTGVGNYTGTAQAGFAIAPANIAAAEMSAPRDGVYTGAEQKPDMALMYNGRALSEGADYTLTYADNLNAGAATVTVAGVGNYTGTAQAGFVIMPASLEACAVSKIDAKTYTGEALKPAVAVRYGELALKAGRDYEATYRDNKNAGTASVVITGAGNYTGTATASFTIKPVSLKKCAVSKIDDKVYAGKALKPAVTVRYGGAKLKAGRDYEVTYKNNDQIGKATVGIAGKGNYTGTARVSFAIKPKTPALSKIVAGKKRLGVHWKTVKGVSGYEIEYSVYQSFKKSRAVRVKGAGSDSFSIKDLGAGKTYHVRIRAYREVGKKKYRSAWSKVKSQKTK